MAAFIAKQMMGSQLNAVKGKSTIGSLVLYSSYLQRSITKCETTHSNSALSVYMSGNAS